MKAELKLHQKKFLEGSLIIEIKLWEVASTKKYPDGVKYSLIVVDLKANKRVLMDNHAPKGHHYHLDNTEVEYQFNGIGQLIEDFKSLVKIHLGVIL